jgi:hypothetical protein
MKLLSRTQVLTANDVVTEDVATPEWAPEKNEDGSALTAEQKKEYGVRIRNLTGGGRGVFIQQSLEMKKKEDNKEKVNFEIEMLLVAMTAVGDDNKRLFAETDVAELGQRNAHPIARLAAVAQRLSALDKASQENATKNSPPAQS